jgi:hemerythrin
MTFVIVIESNMSLFRFLLNQNIMSAETPFQPLDWKSEFAVNLEFVDNHHKKFLDLTNEMKSIMNQKSCDRDLSLIFIKLIHYTEDYFQEEEMYFKQLDYPNFKQHKDQHNQFIRRIRDFQESYMNGDKEICLNLLKCLDDFFVTHILGYDREAVSFLSGKGMK